LAKGVWLPALVCPILVIVFWSTYCDSCKSELQHLKILYKELAGSGLEILAVSMDMPDAAGEVMSDVHKYALPFPVALDTGNKASGSLNPANAQPFTMVVDKDMKIAYTHESYFPGDIDKLRKVVLDALGR
jgi:peroxiredoxin